MSGSRRSGQRRWLAVAAVATLALLLALAMAADGGMEANAASDAGGKERTEGKRVLEPRDGDLYGFSGIRPRGDLSPGTTAGLIAGINGNASRTVIHWQSLEPRRDVYDEGDFRPYQQLYDGLRKRNIRPIFVLQYAPVWARDPGTPTRCGSSDDCHYPPADSMLGEWREFVREIATRFPAAIIEVWNEPNYRGQWRSGVNPARYARLLVAADEAVKSVDPGRTALAGGLGTAVKEAWKPPAQFLREAYAARPSIKGHTLALNLHIFPGHTLGPGSAFARDWAQVRAVRNAAGDSGTPIFVSELGRTTTGPMAMSEQGQARILVGAARKILAMRDSAGLVLYTLADRDEFAPTAHEHGFGVLDAGPYPPGTQVTPKPAYCALRLAAGRSFPGCPRVTPKLQARVRPRRARARPGGAQRRFFVRVTAPTAQVPVRRVRVCLKAKPTVRAGARSCRFAGTLDPGKRVRVRFKGGLEADVKRGRHRLTFTATGRDAKRDKVKAYLRPARGG